MKPMPAKPRSIMAQVEGSGTAPTALVVVIGGRIEYPVNHVVREVCDLRPRTATVFALEVELGLNASINSSKRRIGALEVIYS
jgi:hypothetical protein